MQDLDLLYTAREYVQDQLQYSPAPEIAVILGTGLGQWAQDLHPSLELSFSDIPGLPGTTVQSHAGRLLYLQLESRPVLLLQGRFHLYEGYTPEQVCRGVRLAGLLGAKTLLVTNAAGAINPGFTSGSLMLIRDHINMTGHNPLLDPGVLQLGSKFPDMSAAYDAQLQALAMETALHQGLRLEQGVYAGVLGPSLETPAETRALRILGADAVGMSTVMEVIAARQMGQKVLGISCLTNKNLPDCMQETSFEDIVQQAEITAGDLGQLLSSLLPRL